MLKSFQKYLHSWNHLEKTLLFAAVISILGVGWMLNCQPLAIAVAFIGFLSSISKARGKVLGQVLGVVVAVLYCFLSFSNHYYGEVIVHACVILPFYIIGIFSWHKHRDRRTSRVRPNEIRRQEWLVLFAVNFLGFIGLYYLLATFNTSQLLVSTLSMNIKLTATYLLVRRSKYSFIFSIIHAFVSLALWGAPVLNGEYQLLPMVFNALILIVNYIYAFQRWSHLASSKK